MRDLFSIVAVLLVAVLCAALAVPYFVDWESRRAEVEAALGRAFGVEVRTEGAITVRLLPTPRLDLERISVGGDAPFLTAEALNVALEAPPLISGRIEVTSARLVRPELRIIADENGALRLPARIGAPLSGIETAGIARLEVAQGTIRVTGSSGGTPVAQVIGPVDASASAPTLSGPWRIDGRYGDYTFYAATGVPAEDGQLRLKLRATDADTGGHADFDGHLLPEIQPRVSGRFTLSQPLTHFTSAPNQDPQSQSAQSEAADAARISASADIAGAGWRFEATNLEIRSGDGTGALLLNGGGTLDAGALLGGEWPRLALDLSSRRLDVRPFIAAWSRADADAAAATRFLLGGLPFDLSLDVGSVAFGAEEFGVASLVLHTDPSPGGVRVSLPRLDLALPGGGSLKMEDAALDSGAGFAGTLDFSAGDVGRLANALKDAAVNASTVAELGLMLRASHNLRDWPGLALRGHIEVSEAGVAVSGLSATAGESTLSGDLTYTHALGNGRAHADARLHLQGVDLAALPRLDPMALAASGVDLDVALEARRLRFGSAPASEGRRITARFSTTEDGVTIKDFDLTDPDGASLVASGHLGEDGGRIVATMEADDPAALLALYRPFLPDRWGDLLAGATPALAPLKLEATIARPGMGSPLVAVVRGNAAGADVEGRIVSDPGGPVGGRAVIDLRLASPDAAGLIRQLGLGQEFGQKRSRERDGRPATAVEFTLSARGDSFAQLDGQTSLSTPAGRLSLDGRWREEAGRGSLSGPVRLETDDLAALAGLLGGSFPVAPAPIAALLAGELEWRPYGGPQGKSRTFAVKDLVGAVAGIPVTGRLASADGGIEVEVELERLALANALAFTLGSGARPLAGQVWSSERLGETARMVTGTLRLTVKELAVMPGLTLLDAPLRVEMSPQAMTLAITDAAVAGGGRAQGEIAFQRLGTQVNMLGSVAAEEVALAALTGQAVPGTATGRMEFGAAAESVAGIVANLAGGGEIRIANAVVPRFDPGGLARALADLVGEASIDVDTDHVAARLGEALDAGDWPVENLVAPLTLASGTLRFGPLSLVAGSARAGVSGSFDLGDLTLDARAHLSGKTVPEGWSGAAPLLIVHWEGRFDNVRRRIEAGGVANGLAAVSLARELDRIERLEAEARAQAERVRREREERARLEAERREREQQELHQRQQEQERLELERQEAEALRLEAEQENDRQDRERMEALAREAAAGGSPQRPPVPADTAEDAPRPLQAQEDSPAQGHAPLNILPRVQNP